MTKEEYLEFCETIGGTELDKPFPEDFESVVARRSDNKKWFALVMLYQGKHIVNLKCDPMESELEQKLFSGVIPAYHMNKKHWISVFLNSDVPREEIERLTMESYELTKKGKSSPKRT